MEQQGYKSLGGIDIVPTVFDNSIEKCINNIATMFNDCNNKLTGIEKQLIDKYNNLLEERKAEIEQNQPIDKKYYNYYFDILETLEPFIISTNEKINSLENNVVNYKNKLNNINDIINNIKIELNNNKLENGLQGIIMKNNGVIESIKNELKELAITENIDLKHQETLNRLLNLKNADERRDELERHFLRFLTISQKDLFKPLLDKLYQLNIIYENKYKPPMYNNNTLSKSYLPSTITSKGGKKSNKYVKKNKRLKSKKHNKICHKK